jgi:hypothetical protein
MVCFVRSTDVKGSCSIDRSQDFNDSAGPPGNPMGTKDPVTSRPGSVAVAARESPSGRWVPYVRMTRPLKRPMRVALTDHLTGVQSVRESSPAGVQLAAPGRRILLELRLRPRPCYLCRRVDWARRCTPRPDQASSLSLAKGLTTIWVSPPKYTQV